MQEDRSRKVPAAGTRRSFIAAAAALAAIPLASCGGGGGGGGPVGDLPGGPAPGTLFHGILVEPNPAAVGVGASTQLRATASYSDGTYVDVTERAAWSSSDPAIARVVGGTLIGVAPGVVTITAAWNGTSHTARVDVGVAWRAAGELLAPRAGAEAVALKDGRVLVMGSEAFGTNYTLTTEVFDPATRRSVAAESWTRRRRDFTATLLDDGRVLVAGGYANDAQGQVVNDASAILFDPASLAWSDAASMANARSAHTATLLPDGRVLVVGGAPTTEIYDPAANRWTATAPLPKPRTEHTATLLRDGRVLVFGGFDGGTGGSFTSSLTPTNRVELFDSRTETWTTAAPLPRSSRYGHTATLLPDGRVLVAGGSAYNDVPTPLHSRAELFDHATGTWTESGSMFEARYRHHAALLPDGRVLVASGISFWSYDPVPPEIFDPANGTWSGVPMLQPRSQFPIVTLPDGTVLALGGARGAEALASVESYR